jgi:hypothetical protein
MASRPTWNDAVEKIAMYARSNCKNRSGVLIIRPGQLSLPHDAKQEAELRCHYFKGAFVLIRLLLLFFLLLLLLLLLRTSSFFN